MLNQPFKMIKTEEKTFTYHLTSLIGEMKCRGAPALFKIFQGVGGE
jgi:hypothetical protein